MVLFYSSNINLDPTLKIKKVNQRCSFHTEINNRTYVRNLKYIQNVVSYLFTNIFFFVLRLQKSIKTFSDINT